MTKQPHRSRWTAVGALLAVLSSIVLSACTGTTSPAKHSSSTGPSADSSVAAPRVSPPPTFFGTKHALPTGSATKNNPALYKDVALTGCEATSQGWQATGTATNNTSATSDYTVLVLFTDAQARDIDSATATIHVAPGKTGHWSATRTFTAPKGVHCVVRAVNGS